MNKNIEKFVLSIANQAFIDLKIKPCEIIFNNDDKICFEGSRINKNDFWIHLDLIKIISYIQIKNKDNKSIFPYRLNSIRKRLKFIVYHEIGHSLQWQKYFNWFTKNLVYYDKLESRIIPFTLIQKLYRLIPLENYADKIAYYLINKQKNFLQDKLAFSIKSGYTL